MWRVGVIGLMLVFTANIASSNDEFAEKERTGWAFYLDNDLLTTGDNDQDYTGGAAATLSGAAVADYPLSVDSWLSGLNRFSGLESVHPDRIHFQRHNFEFGFTLFTPADISAVDPIRDDHPYASLFFVSNTQQTIVPETSTVYQSSLTVGFLGLDVAEAVQGLIHDVVGSDKPKGWDNQISSGGEPTAKYGVSRQKAYFQRYGPRGLRGEFYLWIGASLKYRLYNAILQGQFRDSEVAFKRSELEPGIAEVWVGVTRQFNNGVSTSVFVRGRTKEISGPKGRAPVWGGVIFSRAF